MFFSQKYLLLAFLIFISPCLGKNYNFSVTPENSPEINSLHWKHSATNSAIEINQIEVDILNWRIAANSKKSVQVELLNPIWDFISWNDNKLVLPNVIKISDPVNYRGTPTIYIQVSPWRIIDRQIEVLTSGEIIITVEQVDFPINYSHPYLLNGNENKLHRSFSNHTEYLIIAPSHLASPAQALADMHSDSVDVGNLNTEVLIVEGISENASGNEIREYIIQRIDNDLSDGTLELKYLLLFGDENDIPPIFNNGDYPSDDFYTTADNNNIFSGDPQLASGRIPVSNENDAWTIVEKIKNYTLRPTSGIWRSKVALVADDMYRSCSFDNGESSHTVNSDNIYDSINELLPILPFYGVHYGLQQTSSGCAYPDLTGDLIRTINNGVALINYIGHGDPETWAGEKLISKSRDLPLIQPDDNKLAIWIAGTCSFGKYHGENSFMEALLFKGNGAIALVATTDAVGYTENSNYLNNIFGLTDSQGIQQIITGNSSVRLGELVLNAKNGNFHKFHTFGDPALRLPFPTISENIVLNPPTSITLVEEQTIAVSSSGNNSTLLIRENETELAFGDDSLLYTIPGVTYTQMNSDSSEICFRIPIDAGTCDDCTATIHLYQDNNGFDGEIQFIADISILESEASSNDETGPDIFVSQNGSPIIEGSAIIPGLDLTISLDDSSGINLMETIGHGIRYAFDDDDLTLIPGDEFIYETCSEGKVQIPVDLGNSPGSFHFYLEAWDGVNNRSTIDLDLDILGTPQKSELLLSKVYPFPNPFSEGTHFTMFVSDTPANITITVYSLMGEKVIELPEFPAGESFIAIPWDGKSESGNKIANGAYFYHVKAEKDGKNVFEDIFKLAKVE
ncbi:T9SS C-terminal target domain-containing protein [Candidatus Marinimicrobia bacterium PRS2]|nr:T9SS C-terminal target domain-containing protein [Candidatus Marinimicrobia bacterium PRS2]